MQVKESYKGLKSKNASLPLLSEYITRQRLAKLGFTDNIGSLPSYKVDAFLIISQTLDGEEKKEINKKGK